MGQDKRDKRGDRQGATVTSRRRSSGDSMARRLRAQAVPHARIAGTAAVGAAGAGLGAATDPTTVGLALGLGGAGLAAVAGMVRRWTGRQRAGWVAAAGWCGWVAASGLSWPAAAVLAVGGYGGHLRHWRERRIPDPPEQIEPERVDALDPVTLWAEHIGCSGGALPGSTLSGERRIGTGRRYLVHLVPGRQTLAGARAELPRLRTGLRMRPGQDLALEPHPQTDEATVRLTLVERSPVLARPVPWPGPASVYDAESGTSGTVALGPYVDGDGVARWRVTSPGSLWGGFIAGSIGSGKSRTMEALALGLASGGHVVWYADGQDGTSSPWLMDHADWAAVGTEGIRTMLTAARQVKRLRQVGNRRHRWSGWDPSQGRPGLVIIVDECHVPMSDPLCQGLATELAREGRKVGISLIMASQVATLDAFGGSGGADALRSSVCAGSMLLMRSMSRTTRNVLPGVDVDPTQFPAIPGYGYLIDHSGERRSAPCRSYWLGDDAMDDAAAQVHWPVLEPDAAAAAGEPYQRRGESDDGEDLDAEYAALTGQGPAPAAPSSPAPAGPRQRPEVPTFPDFPAPDRGRDQGDGGTAVEAVRGALATADGPLRPADLMQSTGYGQTRVRQALDALQAEGAAVRTGYGRYALVETTAAAG